MYLIPPRSPYGLIQEDLWSSAPESEWRILVSCILLNMTNRKQIEHVLPEFFKRWSSATTFNDADEDEVKDLISPLGFKNRRTKNLCNMTTTYLEAKWKHARELPGIGEYGARAWEIFCRGVIGSEAPSDHALTYYWYWRRGLEKG